MNFRLIPLFYLLVLLSCSSGSGVEEDVFSISITADREVAILGFEPINLTALAKDRVLQPIEGVEFEFLLDGVPIPDNVFVPTETGSFILRARAGEVTSMVGVKVFVYSLEEIELLRLQYRGNNYLTTQPWSISGPFFHEITIGTRVHELQSEAFNFFEDGVEVEQQSEFQYSEAGMHTYHSTFNGSRTNEIKIEVRPEKEYPLLEIPIVFHTYGVDATPGQLADLIDTLNASFNQESQSIERVRNGFVNPNAVDMRLRFLLASEAPDGKRLDGLGLNVIKEDNIVPVVEDEKFYELVTEHQWDFEKYVNVWMFNSLSIDTEDEMLWFSDFRGVFPKPMVLGDKIDGLPQGFPGFEPTFSGFTVNPLSVFDEHPDYIVAGMGHYLGLLLSIQFGCELEGDFVPDTPRIFLGAQTDDSGRMLTCDEYRYIPSNYMAIGRAYTNFTYDQRERSRAVIERGLGIVGE